MHCQHHKNQQEKNQSSAYCTLQKYISNSLESYMWRADSEKPMRTGQKQGEMQLNCFS
jgi:hypothetical protein